MNSRRKFLQNITASVIAIPFLSKNEYLEGFKDINDRSYDGPVLRVAIMGLGNSILIPKDVSPAKRQQPPALFWSLARSLRQPTSMCNNSYGTLFVTLAMSTPASFP